MSKDAFSPFSNTYVHLEPKKEEAHKKLMTDKASPFSAMKKKCLWGKKKKGNKTIDFIVDTGLLQNIQGSLWVI